MAWSGGRSNRRGGMSRRRFGMTIWEYGLAAVRGWVDALTSGGLTIPIPLP